jgi:DNA-binding NtrC family response regulator
VGQVCTVAGGSASARQTLSDALSVVGFRVNQSDDLRGDWLSRGPVNVVIALVTSGTSGSANLEALLSKARQHQPEVSVMVLGTSSNYEEAVEAMRRGAADYLPERSTPEVLLARLRKVLEGRTEAGLLPSARAHPGLIGSSEAMKRLHGIIDKVSRYKTSVLLLGESGVGKELVARALHANGPRRDHLFVPINCATLGRDLLENELFGHERGAFTGAVDRKKGLFELADGGTLFLDEISEMDPSTQAKLLRVLERSEFRRVGATEKIKVDLSIIAATNHNLADAIASGKFREDLYYRLKVVAIVVPPLRERKEDIPVLIEHFLADFNRRNDSNIRGIAPQVLKHFIEYDWPGNVRELKHAVESAAIMATGELLGSESAFLQPLRSSALDASARSVPTSPSAPTSSSVSASASASVRVDVGTSLEEAERRLILATLQHVRTRADAAKALGIGLRTLYSKLRGYGISESPTKNHSLRPSQKRARA